MPEYVAVVDSDPAAIHTVQSNSTAGDKGIIVAPTLTNAKLCPVTINVNAHNEGNYYSFATK